MNIKYCGAAKDYSGYGEANRHDIAALDSVGVDVTVELTRHCLEIADFGALGELVQRCDGKRIPYKIKIIHTTPNIFGQFIEPGAYHIGRVFWETNKLPEAFARGAEMCDELWTGSEYNAEAIRKAGVTKPIYVIPESIYIDEARKQELTTLKPFIVSNQPDYKFYSIFEWTERKNPIALLKAFWLEFQYADNVSLTLKTFVDNFTPRAKAEVMEMIKQAKKELNLTRYAPVYIYRELMNRNQMYRFHKTFDCFVSSHRGEGWGIPQMEALLMGKPVISTNCGGIHEYLQHRQTACLLDYKLVPLSGNTRNQQWYTQDQQWADISIEQLRKEMRWAYQNREEAAKMGERGQALVYSTFSPHAVGSKMKSRLEEIEKQF